MDDYDSSVDSESDIDYIAYKTAEMILGDENLNFSNFYKNLLDDLLIRYSVPEFEVKVALSRLMSNYKCVSKGQFPEEVDFNSLSCCIGYLHRYAACHTSLVYSVMTSIVHTSPPAEMNALLMKSRLNVVFLGGGPGNDFVGFLSALWGKHGNLFEMDVTVMDKMPGWKTMFKETVETLCKGNYGKAALILDDVNVITSFMEVDLMNSLTWSSEVQSKLKSADVIFMVKFLSHVPDADKLRTLLNVVSNMESRKLLIYIDGPYPPATFKYLCSSYLDTVYEEKYKQFKFELQRLHRFGKSSIKECRAAVKVFVKK